MTLTGLPFEDIRSLLRELPDSEMQVIETVRQRNIALSKFGDPGDLAWLLEWLAGWSGVSPVITRPLVALFVGTHAGIAQAKQGDVTDRVTLLAAGGSPLNTLCGRLDLGLKVFDLALQFPVGNIALEDALDEKSAAGTMAFGMEAIAGGVDLLCLADCASEQAPSAPAIFTALHDGPVSQWCVLEPPALIAEQAVERLKGEISDPLEILRRLGGRETCALAGAIIAARVQHIPVILDGAGVLAAAAVLKSFNEKALDHCIAAPSAIAPVQTMIEVLGIRTAPGPASGLGEGANAAFVAGMLRAAAALHTETPLPQ